MTTKSTWLAALCMAFTTTAQAQAVNNVTEIVTDFGGFWRSGTGVSPNAALNAVKPDNSHDLLAFTLSGVRYSTGVDDALLNTRGLGFTPSQFKSLPVAAIGGTIGSNTKIGLGASYDGVSTGASSPSPTNNIPFYLRDGRNGLNIGTGVANVPSGTLDFTISNVVPGALGDGIPDILVTQIADPSGSQDQYQFLDASNNVIGQTVTVTFTNITRVGVWTADFYEASQNPMTLSSGFTRTDRDLRLWAADLSAFNITAANVGNIRKFRVLLSGNSDLAFVGYNAQTATFSNPPLPVQLTSFSGQAQSTYSDLTWNTAQEVNSEAFEVEASRDGRSFSKVARVAAAGNSTTAHRYAYRHATSQAGIRYYRLRQVDIDGSSTYSSVLTLTTRLAAGNLRVTAGPNPFESSLNIYLSSPGVLPAQATVELHTLTGRRVYQRTFRPGPAQAAALELTDLSGLPAGIYLARVVTGDGRTTTLKVVKQ